MSCEHYFYEENKSHYGKKYVFKCRDLQNSILKILTPSVALHLITAIDFLVAFFL